MTYSPPLRWSKLLLIVLLLSTVLESKKCKKGTPAPPQGPTKVVILRIRQYDRYPAGSPCGLGPALGCRPDRDKGVCTRFYSGYNNNQRHFTEVSARWVNDNTEYFAPKCWSDGQNLGVTVPTVIPLGKTLEINFYSKEKCTNCYQNSSLTKRRSVWVARELFYSGTPMPEFIDFSPTHEDAVPDQYCN